ncbi:TPR-like protein [Ophiocordyceps camponoti-floridani]|uniref:TPR-like protein n=1 Tax=Ophiocordyceps camponoti-floridani TaxID=2030778 RepID=A0A8H4Q914_9HYPO|nr:TPR-like protein [Ophiocordyceps camponoti-floridani]
MRMTLSWREDRLDVAEHMFGKTEMLRRHMDTPAAEVMADALRHIGADLSSKGNHTLALQWLRRAHDLIDGQSPENLSTHGLELRLAICHGRVQSLLAVDSAESLQEANDIVAYVESELGDKPIVLHWRLEILQKSPDDVMGAEARASILRRMVRCFDRSDDGLDFLLHQFTELSRCCGRLALGLLDELFRRHLLTSANLVWIGKGVVRRTWMVTMVEGDGEVLGSLRGVMDEAFDALSGPLKPDAAGAVHSLLWNKAEALFGGQQFTTADGWCEVGLHELLSSAGEANAGKFGRKRILCALKLNDADRAKQAYDQMSSGPQHDSLTSYLMFKVSLLSWDHELGCRSVARLGANSGTVRGRDMLYACVREAQQFGDRVCAVAALRAVAKGWEVGPVVAEGLPAVLRCMIRLMCLNGEEEEAEEEEAEKRDEFAAETCAVFEKAAEHARHNPRDSEGKKVFTVSELDWFRKNAYNLGVKKCDSWPLTDVMRLFRVCLALVESYPPDIASSHAAECQTMALRSHFICATASTSLARSSSSPSSESGERRKHYGNARAHISAFEALMIKEGGKEAEEKAATLAVLHFEAAAWEGAWGICRGL